MTVTNSAGCLMPVANNGMHPHWNGSFCTYAETISNLDGVSPAPADVYTVSFNAVRGLEQYHHGYSRQTIFAGHATTPVCH